MKLMKNWGEYDERNVFFGKSHPNLWCYLPENFFSDFIDSFSEILKSNPKEHKTFLNETIINIWEFCIAILRTE